jgi:thymidylate kinase
MISVVAQSFVGRVLEALERAGIEHCILRDGERLASLQGGGELDILVAPESIRRTAEALGQLGFVRIAAWGHSPHRFFVVYDAGGDLWLKVDVVDQLRYGRPTRFLDTRLHRAVLRRRIRSEGTYLPDTSDEFLMTLLHCGLDKGRFSEPRAARLRELLARLDADAFAKEVQGLGAPPDMPARLLDSIRSENWSMTLDELSILEARMKRRDPWRSRGRTLRDSALRKLERIVRFFAPRAITVALLAPDGAGKSTLASDIERQCLLPVRQVYMGLYQRGSPGHSRKIGGAGFLGRVFRQWGRYLAARRHLSHGRLVIFDRYSFDALLAPQSELSLGKRFRRWALAHCCPAPDLTIILDAPAETLYARKREQTIEALDRQRMEYRRIAPLIPHSATVDASREAGEVRRDVTRLVWNRLIRRLQSRIAGVIS